MADKSHHRDSTSRRNPESAHVSTNLNEALHLLVELLTARGGEIPMQGRLSVTRLAWHQGCTTETVRNHLKRYKIRTKPFAGEQYIDAAEYWDKTPATDDPPKRGGNRRKKE